MSITKETSGRGGAREGAGRPLSESPKKNQIRVTDEEKKLISLIRKKDILNKVFNFIQED